MYFKLDGSLAHSSLKFFWELSHVKVLVYLDFRGRRVNEMLSNLTDKLCRV